MRFVLHYRGPLKANGDRAHKHAIRRHFHKQLRELWRQPPLDSYHKFIYAPPEHWNLDTSPMQRKFFAFVPLVRSSLFLIAELRITWLRHGAPGHLLQAGDIDNRLKTLFDALATPQENQTPDETPADDESPYFYTLLEDDKLVTAVNVTTEQLLETGYGPNEVELYVGVRVRTTRSCIGNDGLGD